MLEAMTSFHFLGPGGCRPVATDSIGLANGATNAPTERLVRGNQSTLLDVLLDSSVASTAKRLRAAMAGSTSRRSRTCRPCWQKLPQPVEKKSDALVIVMDLSLSMFAQDVTPSRLPRPARKLSTCCAYVKRARRVWLRRRRSCCGTHYR